MERDARGMLARQADALRPGQVFLARAAAILSQWMTSPPDLADPGAARAWLSGCALLAEPVLPRLAGGLWAFLGLDGKPATHELATHAETRVWRQSSRSKLHRDELEPWVRIAGQASAMQS